MQLGSGFHDVLLGAFPLTIRNHSLCTFRGNWQLSLRFVLCCLGNIRHKIQLLKTKEKVEVMKKAQRVTEWEGHTAKWGSVSEPRKSAEMSWREAFSNNPVLFQSRFL